MTIAPSTRHAAVAVTAASALTLAACSGTADADPSSAAAGALTPVTVVLDWTPNTNHSGVYIALDKGWYEEAGLDVTVIEPGETDGLQLVAAGQADFAFSHAQGLLPARAAGADVVSVAAIIHDNTSSFLSLAEDGIERPKDLEGKVFGTWGDELGMTIINEMVACDGGDPELVEFTPLASADFRLGLTEDQYDAAWVFDAWDTIRLSDVDGLEVNTLAFRDWMDCIPNWYTPMLAANGDSIAEDPDTVAAFMDVTARGFRHAMDTPSDASDALMEAAPELEEPLVVASAQWLATQYAPTPDQWGLQHGDEWDRFATWMVDKGLLEDASVVEGAWTNEFVTEES
ncbi:ABC transporter substrate-binding protein [Demequina globuliformis]|uniref:ABC transporter substrate-binding protein n=1 Tax=Demequina globuliformis TaxID=676202 RepID=UPI000B30FBFA|nr:ABC transporter substrate-binding protein [Demequina globuliformis]